MVDPLIQMGSFVKRNIQFPYEKQLIVTIWYKYINFTDASKSSQIAWINTLAYFAGAPMMN